MQIGIGEDMTAIDDVFTRSKVNVTIIFFVKGGFRSFSWELFIEELAYFTRWLVLMRTWPLFIFY